LPAWKSSQRYAFSVYGDGALKWKSAILPDAQSRHAIPNYPRPAHKGGETRHVRKRLA